MNATEMKKERAILAGVHTGSLDVLSDTTEETMAELARLADTADAEVVATMIQNKSTIENLAATERSRGRRFHGGLIEECVGVD